MKNKAVAVGLIFLANLSPSSAGDFVAHHAECLLEVDGKVYINGACNIREEPDFDITNSRVFQLGVDNSGNSGRYWAYVLIDKSGAVDGSWNAGNGSHAQARLGTLVRLGPSCWANERTKICATKTR